MATRSNSTVTRTQLRKRFGTHVDLTDASVRDAIFAFIADGVASNHYPVAGPSYRIPTPPAQVLVESINRLAP